VDADETRRLLSETARAFQPLDAESSAAFGREMLPDLPDLMAVPAIARQSRQVIDEHVAAITAALVQAGSGSLELAPITVPFARDCAIWDVPAAVILRTYQRGHQRVWQLWKQRITEHIADAEARTAVLALCADVLLDYVTAGIDATAQAHAAQREIRLRGEARQQRDDVMALLEGRPPAVAAQLCERLGIRSDGSHVAFVCWADVEPGERDRAALDIAARDWALAVGGAPPLVIPVDSAGTWGWITSPDPRRLDGELPAPADWFHIALGTVAVGLDGFRHSHAEALRAQAVATAGAVTPGVTRYADIATLAVLTEDLEALRRYVATQLGELAGVGEREQRLRATVLSWLEGGENVRAAARELNFHRNTIQQRLDLAARLRGRPLEEERPGLALALRVAEHYGETVLSPSRRGERDRDRVPPVDPAGAVPDGRSGQVRLA
jgi:hypothetical protein